jgi:hypothetical protein
LKDTPTLHEKIHRINDFFNVMKNVGLLLTRSLIPKIAARLRRGSETGNEQIEKILNIQSSRDYYFID